MNGAPGVESADVDSGGMSTPRASEVVDLLARPLFAVHQVDRILGLAPGTARRWIDGYTRGKASYLPVVRPEPTGNEIVTWGEFVETRLLSEYRTAGVRMFHLRPTVVALRRMFPGIAYPLAHARPYMEAEGRELVWRAQEESEIDADLRFVLRTGQIRLSIPTERFVNSASWVGGIAERIRPVEALQNVWVDPDRNFGEPTVRAVPTDVLREQYEAGDPVPFIARAYQLPEDHVHEAIRYELMRDKAAVAA